MELLTVSLPAAIDQFARQLAAAVESERQERVQQSFEEEDELERARR
jgi:hypothetical protein